MGGWASTFPHRFMWKGRGLAGEVVVHVAFVLENHVCGLTKGAERCLFIECLLGFLLEFVGWQKDIY